MVCDQACWLALEGWLEEGDWLAVDLEGWASM